MKIAQVQPIHAYIIFATVDQMTNVRVEQTHVQKGNAAVVKMRNAQKEKLVGLGNVKVCDY